MRFSDHWICKSTFTITESFVHIPYNENVTLRKPQNNCKSASERTKVLERLQVSTLAFAQSKFPATIDPIGLKVGQYNPPQTMLQNELNLSLIQNV